MQQKTLFIQLILALLFVFSFEAGSAQKVRTIVLDAGHGGKDSGAKGRRAKEKDINLDVVLRLRDYIKENLKEVKVILTRDNDYFVELHRRAQIANQNRADLFISVHCNATRSRAIYGAETFVMGLHKTEANLEVAKAENAAVLLEDNYVEKYDGFDPNSPEGTIFFSMMQNAFLTKSLELASKVQHEMVDRIGMLDRGVKQAGFLVLYKTSMPSILVELGFMSNADDEAFLISEKGKNQFAHSIYKAIVEYKNETENRKGSDKIKIAEPKIIKSNGTDVRREPPIDPNIQKTDIPVVVEDKNEIKAEQKTEAKPEPKTKQKTEEKPEPKAEPKPEQKTEEKTEQKAEQKPEQKTEEKPEQKTEEKPEQKTEEKPEQKTEEKPEQKTEEKTEQKTEEKTEQKTEEKTEQKSIVTDDVIFSIQFASSSKEILASSYRQLPNVFKYYQDKQYKFVSGAFSNIELAASHLKYVQKQGYTDAFIVAFQGQKRISVEQARTLTANKK